MGLDITLLAEVDTGGEKPHVVKLFDAYVTHNLTAMAAEAGIYEHIWQPYEVGIKTAGELIEPLTKGLQAMRDDPVRFEKHNPPNGFGSYERFVPWLEKYIDACKEHPKAQIDACR